MLNYFDPTSTMTLREAIQELRAVEERKSDISVKISTSNMEQQFSMRHFANAYGQIQTGYNSNAS
jgi:hypothetical protein